MAFFNIVKANAEITRLTAALAASETALAESQSSQPEALKLAEEALAESDGKRITAETALATIKTELATVKTERDTFKAKSEGVAEQVKIKAAQDAAAIVAGQGASAATVKPEAGASGGDILAELEAITDPSARSAFIKKNRSALFAAGNKK